MSDTEHPLYWLNEGTLPVDVPGDWEDHTINVLRVPGHGHAATSLVVTREKLPLGWTVAGYVHDQMRRLAAELKEFQVTATVPILYPDQRSEAICARWRAPEGPMDQVICCVSAGGQRLVIFTATHPAPMPDPLRRRLLQIIAGFRPIAAAVPAAETAQG
ncbi:hypothetical protein GCM10011611_28130 [Aliidongia dinghuensis]|uniref:DUF1795 domain-containing protein n=1 Tax=Aliidongia dinghuensis TaxID=1867774 RepID=A0A8J2YTQ3_9PROT|nr:DcrB-related protein [Aliidongia dinghuensis]GGF20470.1 hypothetical protein GCM10011611_28130 [Aliidongia dinghuensis]